MMTETPNPSAITSAQSRAARALLGWSQQDLARKAAVAISTVADFERGRRSPVPNNLEALKSALENAGITFPPGGALAGPPLKIEAQRRASQEAISPIRWITESDLDNWANSRFGQSAFPELIRRLVLAEAGYHPQLRFPTGDSIAMQGWDGETKIDFDSPIIPSGVTGWELGTDKQPKTKADQAYKDRVKNTLHLDPPQTTFVFATPRRWAKKGEWQKERKAEGFWKDVRAIDAVDLVQWLERFPGVALWFARLINILPPDVSTLEQAWREWSVSTTPPLSVQLLLADRDDTASRIWQWLLGEPNAFALQADAPIEAKAFLHAAIEQYPPGYRDFYHSRTIVAANAESARALADVGTPLVIVLEEAESGLVTSLVRKGHHVFVALTGEDHQGVALQRPIRYTIQEDLIQMGLRRDEARNLAHDSARSLTILRRLMPSAPAYKIPEWATAKNARYMVPALLTGAWDESKDADKRILESLSGLSYADLVRELTGLLKEADSPLRKIGAAWKIASPRDAWFRLAGFLITADLEKFDFLATDVLGSVDPRFNLEPDARWRGDIAGEKAAYSGLIRTGMAEVLVLLSVFGSRASQIASPNLHSDKVVRRLLGKADSERWWSLHQQLGVLAEASPDEFLDAVDKSLDQKDSPIMRLFVESKDFFGRGGEYAHLLSALEILAWSPEYLARVTDILAKLTRLDPGGGYTNRPHNTFQQIYRLWYPQTAATLEQRNAVLKRLRKTHPDISWKLLLNLYPKTHDTASDSPVPRWRDFSASDHERATHAVVIRGAQAIGAWLLEDVGTDAHRWKDLIERLSDFAPDLRKKTIEQLATVPLQMIADVDLAFVQQALRRLLNHHRQFPDAGWVLPPEELDHIENVYSLFKPKDELLQIKWLFDDHHPPVLHPHEGRQWEANRNASEQARREAVSNLVKTSGVTAVLDLYEIVNLPGLVGSAYAQVNQVADFAPELVEALKTEGEKHWNFAHGGIITYLQMRGLEWGGRLVDRALKENWGDLAVERLLLSLPKNEHFMRRAAEIGGAIEAFYWAKLSVFQVDVEPPSRPGVVERLLEAGRARETVQFAGQYVTDIPSVLLVRLLREAVSGKAVGDDGNEATMFQHYVTAIFEKLDNDNSITEGDIARLEWAYLRLLEHSNREPKALPQLLATSPEFFVEVLSIVYRAENEEPLDETADDYEAKASMASQAWTLLHTWKHIPGGSNGKIDGAELEKWVRAARILCDQVGRAAIGDQVIGQMLAYSPADEDGTWPCRPVRELIEITRSNDLETGIQIGIVNKRGVTTRLPTDGGMQERDLAKLYRGWSGATRLEFPRTSALLAKIAKSYEWDAKAHDEDADMQQW